MKVDEHPITKRWHRDTRYYEARLTRDLWGNWVIQRIWGRRNSPAGGSRTSLHTS